MDVDTLDALHRKACRLDLVLHVHDHIERPHFACGQGVQRGDNALDAGDLPYLFERYRVLGVAEPAKSHLHFNLPFLFYNSMRSPVSALLYTASRSSIALPPSSESIANGRLFLTAS